MTETPQVYQQEASTSTILMFLSSPAYAPYQSPELDNPAWSR